MLDRATLKAFLPTVKPGEAKFFFREVLGFELLSEDGYAMEFEARGTKLRVTTVRELTPHIFTVLGWAVPAIDEIVSALKQKGIHFENYGLPGQDPNGIWTAPGGTQIAWFKDLDGNMLSIESS